MDVIEYNFVVLVFNHEKYIIQHLESIKYQLDRYGDKKSVNLIINDDASKDRSVSLAKKWVEVNERYFNKCIVLENNENIGTCKSLFNAVSLIERGRVKITAGDDIYSSENIFELMELSEKFDIVSGVPVSLIDDAVYVNEFDVRHSLASDIIYEGENLYNKLNSLIVLNAPNMCYQFSHLKDHSISSFVKKFDVIEDWPLQLAISVRNPLANLKIIHKCYVLYRRTAGSAYIVASKRFVSDKNNVFDYLINNSGGLRKLILENRRYCFNSTGFRRRFNFSFAIYAFKYLIKFKKINYAIAEFNSQIDLLGMQKHYELIKKREEEFFEKNI